MSEKITVLGVGRKCAEVIEIMLASKSLDVDFAFLSRESDGVDLDYFADIPSRFHVPDERGCEQIVLDNFSDNDMLFIISPIEDMSFASKITQAARAIGILTIGIVFLNDEYILFKQQTFIDKCVPCYDAVFAPHLNENSERVKNFIKCITDLITKAGFINLDSADIKTFLEGAGDVLFSTGYCGGCSKVKNAATQAINESLYTLYKLKKAHRLLMNITTASEIVLGEIMEAVNIIEKAASHEAQVIWGHVIDESLNDSARVSLIATEEVEP